MAVGLPHGCRPSIGKQMAQAHPLGTYMGNWDKMECKTMYIVVALVGVGVGKLVVWVSQTFVEMLLVGYILCWLFVGLCLL